MSEYRGPIAWMARNSVAANLLALMIGSVFFVGKTKQEVFPQFELDLVNCPLSRCFSGGIEQGVVLAIERCRASMVKETARPPVKGWVCSVELLTGVDAKIRLRTSRVPWIAL